MNFNIKAESHARFKVIKGNKDGVTFESDWFDNEVLDSGLDRMAVGTWIDRCCVGTGNSPPLPTQTSLDSFKASTTTRYGEDNAGVQVTTEPYYMWARRTWRFAEGVATGNLTEVGLGWSNTNLWNRSLMKDSNSNPTTITVLSDEYLDIISEVRLYPQRELEGSFELVDKNNVLISQHDYFGYSVLTNPIWHFNKISVGVSISNNQIYSAVHNGSITDSPTSTDNLMTLSSAMNSTTTPTYTNRSCTQVFNLDISRNNYEHKSFFFRILGFLGDAGAWGYKFQMNPTITKTSDKAMTYTFTVTWGRYAP